MRALEALLERYVEAKDLTRPQLMRDIYAADAVLTYSIATDAISFPARVAGVDGITQTLVIDFAHKFDRCKTFYVCDALELSDRICRVPWLVLMRERVAASLRVGKGYYVWTLTPNGQEPQRIAAMHIHIRRMDSLADPDSRLLQQAQAPLPYPWLRPAQLHAVFQRLTADPAFAFLEEFTTPLDLRSELRS